MNKKDQVHIYTDGACSGNPGPGGYGIVMEWFWRGQTIGKRLVRLRVMDGKGWRF